MSSHKQTEGKLSMENIRVEDYAFLYPNTEVFCKMLGQVQQAFKTCLTSVNCNELTMQRHYIRGFAKELERREGKKAWEFVAEVRNWNHRPEGGKYHGCDPDGIYDVPLEQLVDAFLRHGMAIVSSNENNFKLSIDSESGLPHLCGLWFNLIYAIKAIGKKINECAPQKEA